MAGCHGTIPRTGGGTSGHGAGGAMVDTGSQMSSAWLRYMIVKQLVNLAGGLEGGEELGVSLYQLYINIPSRGS